MLPADLDGRAGRCRAPREECLLVAANDHAAIGAWLASKRPAGFIGSAEGDLSSTQRSYRKEAERLLLWSVLERKTALSSLSVEDAAAFRAFLADPPSSWCGPRHHQRWSPLWRPLEGALTPTALRQSLIILRSLFAFLTSQAYVRDNPFADLALPPNPQRPLGSSRTLSPTQWDHIDVLLQGHTDSEPGRRLRRAMRWLQATGLRLGEIMNARCEDLEPADSHTADGVKAPDWLLTVIGKGGRRRQVPVPAVLVDELGEELARQGFDREVAAAGNKGIHVLARFDPDLDRPAPWSASGLYQAIKAFLAQAANNLEGADAQQLRKASTHWLRHTHGMAEREGRMSTPSRVVQKDLGHASAAATTSICLAIE